MNDDKIADLDKRLAVVERVFPDAVKSLKSDIAEIKTLQKEEQARRNTDRRWWLIAVAVPTINTIVLYGLNGGFSNVAGN